jgi:acyl carrier protein
VPSVVEIADRIDTDANHKPRADTAVSVARPQRSDVATTPWIQRLTALLASLLGGEVAPDDNFFDLGLNSISLLNLHALLQRETGGRLPVTELFTHTTVRSLAGFLQRSDQSGDWDHKLARRGAGRDRGRGAAATRRAVRARIHRENWGNE